MPSCNICLKTLTVGSLSGHLRKIHLVRNTQERKYLLNLCNKRTNIRQCPCPVPGCEHKGMFMERHLDRVHEPLGQGELEILRDIARRRETDRLLQELRMSNPAIPLITTWDDNDDLVMTDLPASKRPARRDCQKRGCRALHTRHLALQRSWRWLKEEHQRAKRELWASRRAGTLTQLSQTVVPEQSPESSVQRASYSSQGTPVKFVTLSPDGSEKTKHMKVFSLTLEQTKPWADGSRRGNRMRSIVVPTSFAQVIEAYQEAREGIDPSPTTHNNAGSKVSRVKAFICYMMHNVSKTSDWRFLFNTDRIKSYYKSLASSALMPTSVLHYLQSTKQFLQFASATQVPCCKLNKAEWFSIVSTFGMLIKSIRRPVVRHQQETKRAKHEVLPTKQELRTFQVQARKNIPLVLEKLKSKPGNLSLRYQFYGLLSGYWSTLYGHRPCVLKNMVDQEVTVARQTRDRTVEKDFLILLAWVPGRAPLTSSGLPCSMGFLCRTVPGVGKLVKEHKTANMFAEACIHATEEEFAWVEAWLSIKEKYTGRKSSFVFFTGGTRVCDGLLGHFQKEWTRCGLPGKPFFMLIRTAISFYARQTLSRDTRKKVTDLMAHNIDIADRFYALNPTPTETAEIRELIQGSLDGPQPDATAEEMTKLVETAREQAIQEGEMAAYSHEEEMAEPPTQMAEPPTQMAEREGGKASRKTSRKTQEEMAESPTNREGGKASRKTKRKTQEEMAESPTNREGGKASRKTNRKTQEEMAQPPSQMAESPTNREGGKASSKTQEEHVYRQLAFDINGLNTEQLGHVYDLLQMKESINPDMDELDIDFEKLKPSTLQELQIYVSSVLYKVPAAKKSRKRKRKRTSQREDETMEEEGEDETTEEEGEVVYQETGDSASSTMEESGEDEAPQPKWTRKSPILTRRAQGQVLKPKTNYTSPYKIVLAMAAQKKKARTRLQFDENTKQAEPGVRSSARDFYRGASSASSKTSSASSSEPAKHLATGSRKKQGKTKAQTAL